MILEAGTSLAVVEALAVAILTAATIVSTVAV